MYADCAHQNISVIFVLGFWELSWEKLYSLSETRILPMILFDIQTESTSWFKVLSVPRTVILNDECKDSLNVPCMLFVAEQLFLGPSVVFLKHKSSPMIPYDIQRDSALWSEVSNIEPLSWMMNACIVYGIHAVNSASVGFVFLGIGLFYEIFCTACVLCMLLKLSMVCDTHHDTWYWLLRIQHS